MKYLISALLFAGTPAAAQTAQAAQAIQTAQSAPAAAVQHQIVEIYRIVPGQQEAFLRFIDKCDEANRMAGLPPRQLFVHNDGADWDYLLIQPAETPKGKASALDAAWKKLGLPSGADFFFEIRKYIAAHTDTFVTGPTTAREYLSRSPKP
jgi:hypothetical protein